MSIRRDRIEAKFLDLLGELKPGAGALRLYRALVRDAWKDRQAEKRSYLARLDTRISEIKKRQDRLLDAVTDGRGP